MFVWYFKTLEISNTVHFAETETNVIIKWRLVETSEVLNSSLEGCQIAVLLVAGS